ncbi:MAG: M20/M25/M40 family metallo-hydrolase [Actinobacteria bacterium]|nr:M20/M25/M40 family metallo-hydrolase [Actinomycetota bacterium]
MAVPGVLDLFTELAAIPSPPGQERAVADRVIAYLRELGLEVAEDGAAAEVGSTIGNLLCRLERTQTAGTPIFLCAHLDTVPPEGPIEPVVEDGMVRNAGGTILGADDKAAVAVMLDAARRVVEEGRAHAGVELLFTPKEEVGLLGASAFDENRLAARTGYVYDHAAPIGDVILGAPYSHALEVRFRGRAAHAGMYPEEGRSAIAAAARAIADLRLGRIDAEATANVGTIVGGSAGNIVPERCSFLAEVRCHDEHRLAELLQEMLDVIAFAASEGDCAVETTGRRSYRGYRFRRSDPAIELAARALSRSGYEPRFGLSGGGADANVFNDRGLACVNLANGMIDIHTPDERIAVEDLERMVDVTLGLVEAARDAA